MQVLDHYRLSENFSLGEFYVSADYPEIAKKMCRCQTDILALKLLCLQILQPIRNKVGALRVLSGKRSVELNTLVDGSSESDHLFASGADIAPVSFDLFHVYNWIVLDSDLPYRQVILYPEQGFIHVSNNLPFRPSRHDALVKTEKKYVTYREFIDKSEGRA